MPQTQLGTHWIESLVKGEIGLHHLPQTLSHKEAAFIRREALQRMMQWSISSTVGANAFMPRPI
jgi:hypothetical protein